MFHKNKKRNIIVFVAILVLGSLSACSSKAGEAVLRDIMLSAEEQESTNKKEVIISTTPMETSEMQEDTKPLEENKNFGSVDKEQNLPQESDNAPTREVAEPKDSGVLDDESELTKEEKSDDESLIAEGKSEQEGQKEELPEKGQEQPEKDQQEAQFQTWQSAYLEVIYHLWDYLAPRYEPLSDEETRKKFNDPMNLWSFYFGLHDFNEDGILELITGDGWGLAVFTFRDGKVEKIADLCEPDLSAIWCVNGVDFKDNCIRVGCAGSGGVNLVNFGYIEGEYVLGHYNQWTPTDPIIINGREGTLEEMEKIYTLDYDNHEEEEHRERLQLINENGIWFIRHYESDEESILDINFDFDSVLW